ncbi:MAG: hypothetical protein A2579_09070 [Lysobacterales bacterium RIFOXYD1_FULL_69_11]|nr:MAG: hypothetical protein A2190_01530 [Xanthomonadales bacterium RIFOXYA1_FULL_69_10]OHE86331.1 MAG: hypothetical protein A2579_09070 [Xanthomonadales bacterium RIFOXYD1_FULL_69_11]
MLPTDPRADATWLEIEPPGSIARRATLPPGEHAPPHHGDGRTWVVVPASGLGLLWTALPARQHTQALAAARLLLDDHAASPVNALHVAVSPHAGTAPRLVAWTDPSSMQGWLARAAAHGVGPDALVPDVLLLPHDEGATDHLRVVKHDGRWLVRGGAMAFSAEPELAMQVLGDAAVHVEASGAFLDACARSAGLEAPPLDLLQGAFAPRVRRGSNDGWRRAAVLAGVLVLSPWVLLAADAIRHELASRRLQAEAHDMAVRAAPGIQAGNPLDATAARLSRLRAVDALARDAGALFGALETVPAAHLDGLRYSTADGLRAQIVHPREADLDTLAAALGERGLPLQRTGRQPVGDAVRSDVTLGPGA